MEALLTAIVVWLSVNFGLPENHQHPQIEYAPVEAIAIMRYQGILPTSKTESAKIRVASAEKPYQVVAIYNDKTQTIYLPEGWTGTTPAELSVLVHEMVHHLQNVGGLRHECAQAREKLAFSAQERWLAMFGSNLVEAFDIDAVTLFVRSSCIH